MAATDTDEALARRVQELEDEEFARRMQRGSPAPNTPSRYQPISARLDALEAELMGYITPEHKQTLLRNPRPATGSADDPVIVDNSPAINEDERALRRLQEEEDMRVARELYEREMRVDRLHRGRPVSPPHVQRFTRPPSATDVSVHYRAVPPPANVDFAASPFVARARGRGRARAGALAGGVGFRSREEWAQMAEAERALESNDYEALLELEERMGKVERGLSASQLSALPVTKWAGEAGAVCTICMEELQQGTPVRTLTCLDKFHPACIDQWLKTHLTCPVCRHDLTS